MVEVQKPMFFLRFLTARATLCGDRRGRGAKTHGFLRFLRCSRDPLRGSAWSRCKDPWFFAISNLARATLCGDRRGRGAKTHGFLRFLRCSRDPLRGSAWSRCKDPWFFAISNLARATLCGDRRGAKTHGFCDFCGARESAWSRCKNSRFFATFVVRTGPRELSRGSRACSRNRRVPGSIPPWSAGGRRKMQLAFYSNLRRATCAEQVAQSNLRRPTCTDQFAQSALPRATCAEQLTQSSLHRATCTLHRATCRERNLHRATCREPLAGTNLEQLARSNLHSATCVEQLAQTNLHRPVCAEHLAWCCLALASRSVGKKNASCSVGPTSLAMFCFRANRGLVFFAWLVENKGNPKPFKQKKTAKRGAFFGEE